MKDDALSDEMIKECINLVDGSIRHSTRFFFSNHKFYNELPYKLKYSLVQKVLVKQRETFSFFF